MDKCMIQTYGSLDCNNGKTLNGYAKPHINIDIFSLTSKICNTHENNDKSHSDSDISNSNKSNCNISSNISNSNITNEILTPDNNNFEIDEYNYFDKIYIDSTSMDDLSQYSELTKLIKKKDLPEIDNDIAIYKNKINFYILISLVLILIYIFVFFIYYIIMKFVGCKLDCFIYKK